jgi:hypothetical protein
MPELTPQYPGTIKPVRTGYYLRYVFFRAALVGIYSYWDGKLWYAGCEGLEVTVKADNVCGKLIAYDQERPWCGLTERTTA